MADITNLRTVTDQDLKSLHSIRVEARRLSSLLAAFLAVEEFGEGKIDDGVIRDILEIVAGRVEQIFDEAEEVFTRLSSAGRGEWECSSCELDPAACRDAGICAVGREDKQ